jgi:hypothetical protein
MNLLEQSPDKRQSSFSSDKTVITNDPDNNRKKRLRRRPLTVQRDCPLGVITFEDLKKTDHHVRVLDLSATGIGIESEQPIEPGIIWFKDSAYGQKCGVLVWCKNLEVGYRYGIQFVSLSQNEEECVRQQVEGSQQCTSLPDPQRVVAMLIGSIRKNREETINSQL